MNISAMKQFISNGNINIFFGDYNGYLWKLDDITLNGDGAEVNGTVLSSTNNTLTDTQLSGTATSATPTTLTDTTLTMGVNQYTPSFIQITAGTGVGQDRAILSNTATTFTVAAWGVQPDNTSVYKVGRFGVNYEKGKRVRIISGLAANEVGTIISNDVDTLTISTNWAVNPPVDSEYTVGGYDAYHFTNWKNLTGSYDTLKQMWYFLSNINASGDYNIELIIQIDFDTTITNQTTLLINLSAANAIWGQFIWGQAIWGAQAVFQDMKRLFERFRAIRFGFRNRKAGQPYQVNGFSTSVQDKQLFYRSAP